MSELTELRAEIQEVKQVLRKGGEYLGMQGEKLQQYFLQLSGKENILLAQLRSNESEECIAANGAVSHGKVNNASGGYCVAPILPAKPPPTPIDPSAPPMQFAKDDIHAILVHLTEQEGNLREARYGLRAFASLAYQEPSKVGACSECLVQVRRLMELYPEEEALQLFALKGLCNVAYDSTIARDKLSGQNSFYPIVRAAARSESGQVTDKAIETIARIIAASGTEYGDVLMSLFKVVGLLPESPKQVVATLLAELISNEVIMEASIATQLVASMEALEDTPIAAIRSFELVRELCKVSLQQQEALMKGGAFRVTSNFMAKHTSNKDIQREGIETFCSLVGSEWEGLNLLGQADGIPRIEAAMYAHPKDAMIQIKGVKALACGVLWPEEMQKKAKYNCGRAVELTKAAMLIHVENTEVQVAGVDAFAKYLENHCKNQVEVNDGEGLVKAAMKQHPHLERLQTQGKTVLALLRRR